MREALLVDMRHLLRAVVEDDRPHRDVCGEGACIDCWRQGLARDALDALDKMETEALDLASRR